MEPPAASPEELELLLEDAFVVNDGRRLSRLFEAGGVLAAGRGAPAHGRDEIAREARSLARDELTYVAGPVQIIEARRTALILGERAISVARRHRRGWRYSITVLRPADGTYGNPNRMPRT